MSAVGSPVMAPRAEPARPLRIALIGARGIGASYSGIETYYEEVGARLVSYGHEVLAYCQAPAAWGGSGALLVLLKSR